MNMRLFGRAAGLAVLSAFGLALLSGLGGCATTGGMGVQSAVFRAKDEVAPALVHIRPVKEVFASGRREEILAIGSGFIISPDGYIVTNEHVAGEANLVRCVLGDRTEVEARVVGVDPYTDLAVLKIDTATPLPYVALGDSDKLEAGQVVLALGSPHGLSRSVSMGIVSVTDRQLDGRGTRESPFNTWIQTDAAINPGNSGGPLVNLRGEVIGINARTLRGADNVGFAIPSNTARDVVDAIIREGRVRRAWFGLELQEMMRLTDDPSRRGVLVADVDPLSPGAEAGIRPGDILLAVGGTPANARFEEDLPAAAQLLANQTIGAPVDLTLQRGDEQADIEVTPEELSEFKGSEIEFSEWGFTATELTPQMVRRAQLPNRDGVFVTGTQVGGIASNARLDRGDIILKVDDEPVRNLSEFRETYQEIVASGKRLTLLWVKRGALTRFVMIRQHGLEADDAPLVAPLDTDLPLSPEEEPGHVD